MTQPTFPVWFHEQSAIQHQVEHVLFPDAHKRHDPNAALQAAHFYNQMARDSMRHHGKSKPQQMLTQALLAITGFAVTNHPMTALQVAQETNLIELTDQPGIVAAIGMLIPELKEQLAERLKDNSEWQNILNFEGDADELLKLCREKAITERSSMLDSTLRWAVAAVKTTGQSGNQPHTGNVPRPGIVHCTSVQVIADQDCQTALTNCNTTQPKAGYLTARHGA